MELGSGQSFMIAGLLQNTNNNNVEKAPFLGDLPVLGTLFRSTKFQRNETELVIIVTPYLVRPVSGQLARRPTAIARPMTSARCLAARPSAAERLGRQPTAVQAGSRRARCRRSRRRPGFKL